MEPPRVVRVIDVHEAMVEERRVRSRPRLIASGIVTILLLALLAVALYTLASYGAGWRSFLHPGLLGPVGLLVVLLAAALLAKWRARNIRIEHDDGSLTRKPSLAARLIAGEKSGHVEVEEVSRGSIVARPDSVFVVLEQSENIVALPTCLAPTGFLRSVGERLPDSCAGRQEVMQSIDRLSPPSDYTKLAAERDRLRLDSKEGGRLATAYEDLGCWLLLSRWLWGQVEHGPVSRQLVVAIWRAERMRLPYAPLLSFLDVVGPALSDEPGVVADRLRIALAFRFKGVANEHLTLAEKMGLDRGASTRSPTVPPLPIEEWRRSKKSPPGLRPGLPLVSHRRFRLEEGGLLVGARRDRIPLSHLVAMACRWGFAGIRSLLVFDAWGQRHEITSGSTFEDLRTFSLRLRALAPHVMEIHEETAWALGAHHRLFRLKKAISRSEWAQTRR